MTNSTRTGSIEGAGSLATLEKFADRLPALVAVVLRQLVHVHPDEAVHEARVEVTPVLHRVGKCLCATREPGLDRLGQHFAELVQDLRPEIPPGHADPEWQGKACLEQPPLAEVDDAVKPLALVRELTLVDEEPRVRADRSGPPP